VHSLSDEILENNWIANAQAIQLGITCSLAIQIIGYPTHRLLGLNTQTLY